MQSTETKRTSAKQQQPERHPQSRNCAAEAEIQRNPFAMKVDAFSAIIRKGDPKDVLDALESTGSTLEAGALVTGYDSRGSTPLHWASLHLPSKLVNLLGIYASHTQRDTDTGNHESGGGIDVRSKDFASEEHTPLHWAAKSGSAANVEALLKAGADITAVDSEGYNAAIHASQSGRVDSLHVLLRSDPSLISSVDTTGNSLVQWASYYGHAHAVRYLALVHNASVDAEDCSGTTALQRAVVAASQEDGVEIPADAPPIASDKAMEVVDALLRAGADPSKEDRCDPPRTALTLVVPGTRASSLLSRWESGESNTLNPGLQRHAPYRYALVIFFYVMMLLTVFVYSNLAGVASLGAVVHVGFIVCVVMGVGSHATATWADPGDIPKGDVSNLVNFIERSLPQESSSARLLPSAFCFTCLVERPRRSKHSWIRDACVRRFDHECPWVNNSIGVRTHPALVVLALSLVLGQSLFMYTVQQALKVECVKAAVDRMDSSFFAALFHRPFVVVLSVLNIAMGLFCVVLLVMQARLIVKGVTSYECIVAGRQGKEPSSEFNFGLWTNCVAFVTGTGAGTDQNSVPASGPALFAYMCELVRRRLTIILRRGKVPNDDDDGAGIPMEGP